MVKRANKLNNCNLTPEYRHNPRKFWNKFKSISPSSKTKTFHSSVNWSDISKTVFSEANSFCKYSSNIAKCLKNKNLPIVTVTVHTSKNWTTTNIWLSQENTCLENNSRTQTA